MADRFFLYLKEYAHAQTWVSGGNVPIVRASDYRRSERRGVYTQDELLTREVYGFPPQIAEHMIGAFGGGIYMTDCKVDTPSFKGCIQFAHASSEIRDSHIFCFSRTLSKNLLEKFENKAVVVEIIDPIRLFDHVSKQMTPVGAFEDLVYTNALDRGDFLKSVEDSWQCEARMMWPSAENPANEKSVHIPTGIARIIDLPIEEEVQGQPLIARQTSAGLDQKCGVRQAVEAGYYDHIEPSPLHSSLRKVQKRTFQPGRGRRR